jgi:hypothetical protein
MSNNISANNISANSIIATTITTGTFVNTSLNVSERITAVNVNATNINATSDISGANLNAENISLSEKAVSENSVAGKGQLWVKDSTPNELYFTNDIENDIQITRGKTLASFPSNIVEQTSTGWISIENANCVTIKACGGGGGGGGSGNTIGDSGAGGGSGAYVEVYLNQEDISSNTHLYCVIGDGGTSGGTTALNGGNGSNTVIRLASIVSQTDGTIIADVSGGGGGSNGNNWSKGGIGGNGGSISKGRGFFIPGRNGDQGLDIDGEGTEETGPFKYSTGGNGGDSILGRGGLGAQGNAYAPPTHSGSGCAIRGGGGGGGVIAGGTSYSASAGADGVVIIFVY